MDHHRYEYVVTLKKNSQRATDLFSNLLIFFSVLNFIFEQTRNGQLNYFLSAVVLVLLIGQTLNRVKARRNLLQRKEGHPETPDQVVRYRYLLAMAAVGWLGMSHLQWLFILFVALAFLEYQVKHPLEIGFTHDRVVINSLIRRKYEWAAFSNVILRDGLLTMDFRDNRLFQKEVLDDEEGEADEDEFNDYCKQRLEDKPPVEGLDTKKSRG